MPQLSARFVFGERRERGERGERKEREEKRERGERGEREREKRRAVNIFFSSHSIFTRKPPLLLRETVVAAVIVVAAAAVVKASRVVVVVVEKQTRHNPKRGPPSLKNYLLHISPSTIFAFFCKGGREYSLDKELARCLAIVCHMESQGHLGLLPPHVPVCDVPRGRED